MDKKILLLALPFILLNSCNKSDAIVSYESNKIIDSETELDYSNFDFVVWNDIFNLKEETYYIYIFSYSCSHCNNIKSSVLKYFNQNEVSAKLLEFSKEVQIAEDISSTIGCNSINELYILGTPTLLMVDHNFLILNLAGEKEIFSYINLF